MFNSRKVPDAFYDGKNHLFEKIECHVYMYINGEIIRIPYGEEFSVSQNLLHGFFKTRIIDPHIQLTEISIKHLRQESLPLKIFISHYFPNIENNYVFISPLKDVLFHSNDHALFISSGQLKGHSICQYGAIRNERNPLYEIKDGVIPFSPICFGDITGIFSLEASLAPLESITVYSWLIASTDYNENELFYWDERLKKETSFLHKKVIL